MPEAEVRLRSASVGFTLLEVVIAIVILSSSLVILLGMQSSAVDQTIRDRQEIQAMLLARRILAQFEVAAGAAEVDPILSVGEKEGTGLQVLKDLDVLGEGANMSQEQQRWLAQMHVTQQISYWGIPDVDPQAMKRVVLRIWPEETPDNIFETVYYFPNVDNQQPPP